MTTISENVNTFVRMSKARSAEHQQAMKVALDNDWLAIVGSVLRMELDSMIRTIYLLRHPAERDSILASCVRGDGFKVNGKKRIQDTVMVENSDKEIAEDATQANGWVKAVYDFGNNFVHLTNAHDYAIVDPFETYADRDAVIEYLRHYHQGKVEGSPLDGSSTTLRDLVPYAPHVRDKIATNLRNYLKDLQRQTGG